MSQLRIERVTESTLEDWRFVHNAIIPVAALTAAEVRERMGLNLLLVTYLEDRLVGCATVRPPSDDSRTVTVIVRILEGQRRRGYGTRLFEAAMAQAKAFEPRAIETVVWESNMDGARFAKTRGFVEVSRWLSPEGSAFVTLRRDPSAGSA